MNCQGCTCQVCHTKSPGKDHLTLTCDECEYFYHTSCLDPPLESVPDGDWSCHKCRGDEGETVKLKIGRTEDGEPLPKSPKKEPRPATRPPGGRVLADLSNGQKKKCGDGEEKVVINLKTEAKASDKDVKMEAKASEASKSYDLENGDDAPVASTSASPEDRENKRSKRAAKPTKTDVDAEVNV